MFGLSSLKMCKFSHFNQNFLEILFMKHLLIIEIQLFLSLYKKLNIIQLI